MSDLAINIENLSKSYKIGHQKSAELRHSIANKFKSLFKPGHSDKDLFWALKNINLQVRQGEAVAIIGRNGAGKSTLLKILSRITEPTKGRFEISGRVSSLLEVGTGFHPELSGRENIYLNGTILGMSRREVKTKFDEIVSFSGVEKFIDTPVKHYSSGMKVRLAFSVAAHLEPEILIVDEVLAVGDAEFQKKCLGKMNEVSKNEGRTVLFVSHNMTAVTNLCSHGVLLNQGEIAHKADIDDLVNRYLMSNRNFDKGQDEYIFKNDEIKVRRVFVENADLHDVMQIHESYTVSIEFEKDYADVQYDFTLQVLSQNGQHLFSLVSMLEKFENRNFKGLLKASVSLPRDFFNDNEYILNLMIIKNRNQLLTNIENVSLLTYMDSGHNREGWKGKIKGAIRPRFNWKIETEN